MRSISLSLQRCQGISSADGTRYRRKRTVQRKLRMLYHLELPPWSEIDTNSSWKSFSELLGGSFDFHVLVHLIGALESQWPTDFTLEIYLPSIHILHIWDYLQYLFDQSHIEEGLQIRVMTSYTSPQDLMQKLLGQIKIWNFPSSFHLE